MKKRILYFFVLLCLLFSGCGKEEKRNEEVVTTEEAIPEEQQTSLESVGKLTLEDYLNEKQLLESPIREYGEEEGFIQMEDDMVVCHASNYSSHLRQIYRKLNSTSLSLYLS